ncbi:helix-turn-helix domain-containing protein [Salicibibacter kimchii]|uniref:XRE family transcriptional regulator n=1 Tax=Salicibibacter kimchii TaxID=2099786 RepID=A0A345C0U7_9BACI|nr:helix-turn-helix transcriptional regulator [Salicibibacter kimchii]AXF56828.1 XRE family transcriptional regulator [Salicibibacter kimchii]
MSNVAERLKEQRKKHKFTQQKVAKILGITESGYGYYEQGRNEPSIEMIKKLSETYDVTSDYLLGLTDDPNTQSLPSADNEEEKMFFSGGYESLTEEEKEHLEEELQRFRKMKKRWEELYRKGDREE